MNFFFADKCEDLFHEIRCVSAYLGNELAGLEIPLAQVAEIIRSKGTSYRLKFRPAEL